MRIILSAALALIATAIAHAGVKVTSLEWTENAGQGRFVVSLSAPATEVPEWDVNGGRFAMTLSGAEVEKNTVKKVAGVRLAAANTSRGVLTTLTFPKGQINADDIALTINDGKIEISTKLPLVDQVGKKAFNNRAPAIVAKPQIDKKSLGEDFLNKIEAEVEAKETLGKTEKKPVSMDFKDEIKAQQAAPKRESSFSIVGYAGKFIAFLGFVLLFFWGVIQLMKKGMLSKGKLGFLNNTQLVSVISTTYVAPKRSILMVKAHNQVFLVSSSESGMSFIAEVKDVPGIVKESEKALVGSNFDDNVEEATTTKPKQELQEKVDIYQSIAAEEKSSVQKDIVRFSDELKKKVKNLKSLQ